MSVEDGNHILEIGHGNGRHVENLLARAENLRYIGIDISETMHIEAEKNNTKFQDKAEFVLYEGEILPFEDKTFDKIFTVNTVYFWKNPVNFLNGIYRILKHNGTFVLTFGQRNFMEKLPFTPYNFTLYNNDEMEQLISESHFKRMKISEKEEEIKSKTGEEFIKRKYTVLTINK